MRGVDSHGIRLLPHYTRSALSGRKNPKPNYSYTQKFPAFGALDADNTFGHAAGFKAIGYAMGMAKEFGIGAVAVSNSSHPGAMASFVLKAARDGYVAFAFTNADSLLRSHGGQRAYFGTNPTCFAAPRIEDEPFCLDMAPTIFSWNKLLTYREKGEKLPGEYAADEHGIPTSDPDLARSILPIGTYKGFGLAAMGAKVALCGPPTLLPLNVEVLPAKVSYSIDEVINWADAIIILRLQLERMGQKLIPSVREYRSLFGITSERMKNHTKQLVIMHPGPMNRGIEIDSDVADGKQAIILNQVLNGVASRMAILYLLLGQKIPEESEKSIS